MRKNISGFTLVEILIVIIILVLLALITTLAYLGYQKQTRDNLTKSLSQQVMNFEEKYFDKNGEYLSSRDMIGSGVSGSTLSDAQYDSLAQKLGIAKDSLANEQIRFVPAVASVGLALITEKNALYFMSKDTTNGSIYNFNIGSSGCKVSFPVELGGQGIGSTAYALAYYSHVSDRWIIHRSDRGAVTIESNAGATQPCIFGPI